MRRTVLALGSAILLAAEVARGAGVDLDRRRMLNAAEHVPWRAVGRVNVAGEHFTSMCTGTLIDPDVVLTAAHCITNPRTGLPYPAGIVYFVAGWRMGQKVASRGVAAVVPHPAYRFSEHPGPEEIAADLALLRLTEPIPAEKARPFAVTKFRPGMSLVLISYRRDRPHALTRQDGCTVKGRGVEETRPAEASPSLGAGRVAPPAAADTDNIIALDCDVTFGASGSPLFAVDGARPRIVAVMSAMRTEWHGRLAFAVLVANELKRLLARLSGPRATPAPSTEPGPRPGSATARELVRPEE